MRDNKDFLPEKQFVSGRQDILHEELSKHAEQDSPPVQSQLEAYRSDKGIERLDKIETSCRFLVQYTEAAAIIIKFPSRENKILLRLPHTLADIRIDANLNCQALIQIVSKPC